MRLTKELRKNIVEQIYNKTILVIAQKFPHIKINRSGNGYVGGVWTPVLGAVMYADNSTTLHQHLIDNKLYDLTASSSGIQIDFSATYLDELEKMYPELQIAKDCCSAANHYIQHRISFELAMSYALPSIDAFIDTTMHLMQSKIDFYNDQQS